MRHEVYLEPLGNDFLFGASMPLGYQVTIETVSRRNRGPKKGPNDEVFWPHKAGIAYTVWSAVDPPPASVLRKAPESFLPAGYGKMYLQLPEPLRTGRTAALARDITAGARTNYDRAVAVEGWLKNNLGYTLRMQKPPDGIDPVEFFLFDRKAGHCEYFSSAMVILLRTLDIPARNVNGFLGGEWNEYDDYLMVRAGDAHSWVEVYFPGSGWVTFDPTPPSDEMGRGTGLLDKMRRWFDTMRFKWFKWVIEYDIYQQLSIFESIGDLFEGGGDGVGDAWGATKGWVKTHRGWSFAGATLAALIGIAVYWRRRRRDQAGTGPARRTGRRDPIAALYLQTLELLRKRGYARPTATTPREHADALLAREAPGATPLRELTELYYRAEYGGTSDDAALTRARALHADIKTALTSQ
jgi:transglutaminase-like putative cysteine protease